MLTLVLNTWHAVAGRVNLLALSCPRNLLWAKAMAIKPCMAGPPCSRVTGLLLLLLRQALHLAPLSVLLCTEVLLLLVCLLGIVNVTLLKLTLPTRLLNRLLIALLLALMSLELVELLELTDLDETLAASGAMG